MSTKHTPGPWRVVHNGSGEHDSVMRRPDNDRPYVSYGRIEGAQRLNPQFSKGIATIYMGDGWQQDGGDCDGALAEQESNARLIAAAPDLLRALRASCVALQDCERRLIALEGGGNYPKLDAQLAENFDIIAQAEGQ